MVFNNILLSILSWCIFVSMLTFLRSWDVAFFAGFMLSLIGATQTNDGLAIGLYVLSGILFILTITFGRMHIRKARQEDRQKEAEKPSAGIQPISFVNKPKK